MKGCPVTTSSLQAKAAAQQGYRQRRVTGEVHVVADLQQRTEPSGPGPVESGVTQEIGGLASEARPGLAQAAVCLARLMDNPKAVNQQPATAKVSASLLDKLRSVSAQGRGHPAAVLRAMTEEGGA